MKERSILKNKYYLYLTEFFSGVSVMAVELGASRLLAPYFSSSQIVWTIIIGTIMIALALGNLWGGRTADRNPDPDRLYRRLLLAAVWIAAIPVLGKYIILGISGLLVLTISTHFLVIAAFCACMVIFVFPLFLLGTVTPSLVKYTVDSLEDNGKVVGTLGACNTIGSILGTFLPTFVGRPPLAGLFADAQQIRKPHTRVDAVAGIEPPAPKRHHRMTQRLGVDGGDAATARHRQDHRRRRQIAVGMFQKIRGTALRRDHAGETLGRRAALQRPFGAIRQSRKPQTGRG